MTAYTSETQKPSGSVIIIIIGGGGGGGISSMPVRPLS